MLPEYPLYLDALGAILAVGFVAWVDGVSIRNVAFVDNLWLLFFLIAAVVYPTGGGESGKRGWLVVGLVAVWALRLSVYFTARNRGKGEDYRYQAIRVGNEPSWIKNIHSVFGLQGVLPVRGGSRWLVDDSCAAAEVISVAQGLRSRDAREDDQRSLPEVCGLHRANECVFPGPPRTTAEAGEGRS